MAQVAILLPGLQRCPQQLRTARRKRPLVVRARLCGSREIRVYQLQHNQQRLEAEACKLVEDCQSDIRRQVAAFFAARDRQITPLVEALLTGKVRTAL